MLAFLFDVHPTLMTIQVDMHNPRDINKAIIFSFIGKHLIPNEIKFNDWKLYVIENVLYYTIKP